MMRYGVDVMEADGAREIFPGFYTTGELDGSMPEQAACQNAGGRRGDYRLCASGHYGSDR